MHLFFDVFQSTEVIYASGSILGARISLPSPLNLSKRHDKASIVNTSVNDPSRHITSPHDVGRSECAVFRQEEKCDRSGPLQAGQRSGEGQRQTAQPG